MKRVKQNFIILHDGSFYRVFERLGKNVPFEAYNPHNHLGIGTSVEECLSNSSVPVYQVEELPIEVVFNE